ncbi:MAG: hypothetical protein QM757_38395 [Paludibaculum sp.]
MPAEEQPGLEHVEVLRSRLCNVYWIGGGSCSGKTTIARRIAERFGLLLHSTDDAMEEHSRRCAAEECPLLHQFQAMSMDERWVLRSPEVMLETFHWFRGEGFRCIIEDLLRIPADQRVIVEGFRLLPRLVQPFLPDSSRAVWLLPSAGFRRVTMDRRGGARAGFLARTSDPERALENLLARDGLFTERLARESEELGLSGIPTDPGISEEAVTQDSLSGSSDSDVGFLEPQIQGNAISSKHGSAARAKPIRADSYLQRLGRFSAGRNKASSWPAYSRKQVRLIAGSAPCRLIGRRQAAQSNNASMPG